MKTAGMAGHMASMGEKGNADRVLMRKGARKFFTGKTYGWMRAVCNNEMVLKETRRQVVDPVRLA
jgi:hypothetical protein